MNGALPAYRVGQGLKAGAVENLAAAAIIMFKSVCAALEDLAVAILAYRDDDGGCCCGARVGGSGWVYLYKFPVFGRIDRGLMNEEKTQTLKISDQKSHTLLRSPCLMIVAGGELARRYVLSQQECLIGRQEGVDVSIKERNVSRLHARILIHDDISIIEDMHSTNGTFVNGQRIARQALAEGDLIAVGSTILKFFHQTEMDRTFFDALHASSTRDGLTGLYNRGVFNQRLESEFARVDRYARSLSLVLFDLDDFKLINDHYGHPAGDEVLKTVGAVVGGCVRQNVDVAARYGGEEFALLLPELSALLARMVAEKIRSRVERLEISHEGQDLKVTVSMGIASSGPGIDSAEELLRIADEKLYEAKRKGKNRVES